MIFGFFFLFFFFDLPVDIFFLNSRKPENKKEVALYVLRNSCLHTSIAFCFEGYKQSTFETNVVL